MCGNSWQWQFTWFSPDNFTLKEKYHLLVLPKQFSTSYFSVVRFSGLPLFPCFAARTHAAGIFIVLPAGEADGRLSTSPFASRNFYLKTEISLSGAPLWWRKPLWSQIALNDSCTVHSFCGFFRLSLLHKSHKSWTAPWSHMRKDKLYHYFQAPVILMIIPVTELDTSSDQMNSLAFSTWWFYNARDLPLWFDFPILAWSGLFLRYPLEIDTGYFCFWPFEGWMVRSEILKLLQTPKREPGLYSDPMDQSTLATYTRPAFQADHTEHGPLSW